MRDKKYMNINISVTNDTLSEDEVKKLTQCIREIEQNRPERHINIFIDSPEKSVEEMKRIISSIRPEFPYQKVIEFEKKTK
jgi:lipoate synthase